MPRINAHGHLLPLPHQVPAYMREQEIFWIDDDKSHMRSRGWSRPVTDPSFFIDDKLSWMDRNNIDHAVILVLSQLYANAETEQRAIDICSFQNDFHAALHQDHGDKFTPGFVVPVAHIDYSLKEIERCVKDLDLRLLCLPTHYQNRSGQWLSTADRALDPIYSLANDLGLPVQIHPYDAPRFIHLPNMFWRYHLVWMCAQSADHYHFYTLLDFANKYPNIRTAYAHGNQFAQMNTGRRARAFKGRPDLFVGAKNPLESIGDQRIFFDSIVHDVLSFELLVKRSGVRQIMAGLDDPYPLGEMEDEESYPGRVIDQAVDQGIITSEDRDKMWFDNVVEWLGFNPLDQ